MGKKKKVILPPDLPPEIAEEDIELSDEDLDFVHSNKAYAGFLSRLDTKSIDRHVVRVADTKEDELEALYERRLRKASLQKHPKGELQVDPVDALPVKTLDGELYYRTIKDTSKETKSDEGVQEDKEKKIILRLTKAERRQKLKKSKKEAKIQAKIGAEVQETLSPVAENPHVEVLANMEKDISAEELLAQKKNKLAEAGVALLEDPESNIKNLKDIMRLSDDEDQNIVKLALLSLLAVFKDIIPGYRIRLPTEKEQEMKVSKEVRKTRLYESTLLRTYKAYLLRLIALLRKPFFCHVAIRCICSLLDAVPHFNFMDSLLATVVDKLSSEDDVVRSLCCSSIKTLFVNEGKHGGEATVEAVRLISNYVKIHNCQLRPDSVEVFLSLTFDEDLGKSEYVKEKEKPNKKMQRQNAEHPRLPPGSEKRPSKQELAAKTREEVKADLRAASFVTEAAERRRMQTETLSAVFETYFRILKQCTSSDITGSAFRSTNRSLVTGSHPLLAPCLKGLAKFSHLIDLDFMGDLMQCLKKLASYGGQHESGSTSQNLLVSERMQCCIVAFKVMRNNLDALNVDLQDFFVQLYNLLLDYRPCSDPGEVLAEALKIMLCDGKHHDMQRTSAFVKRLATFSLCFGSAEAAAALVTLKHLVQKNSKCRNLLENDAGGGSMCGLVVKYQPDAVDPNLSGALASVLWELSLLNKHYHPTISSMASSISSLSSAQNSVYLSNASPQQAFNDLSIQRELLKPVGKSNLSNKKRKSTGSRSSLLTSTPSEDLNSILDEDELRSALENHFIVIRDISETEKLRGELKRTQYSIQLYKHYKQQNKRA